MPPPFALDFTTCAVPVFEMAVIFPPALVPLTTAEGFPRCFPGFPASFLRHRIVRPNDSTVTMLAGIPTHNPISLTLTTNLPFAGDAR